MFHGRIRAQILLSIVCVCLCGCHSGDSEHETTWATDAPSYTPHANSENAFDAYALAAEDAERLGKSSLDRVFFFPDQKTTVIKEIASCVKEVTRATKLNCEFKFVPHKPFKPVPYQAGWRLIGRVYQWNTENACTAGDYDTAITNMVVGTKFGFDLTGGGATDASLGLAIANDLRRAIATYLSKMSPSQLDRLARGIKDAMMRKPSITDTLKNEHENLLQSIQFVQDSLKGEDLKPLQTNLGPDVNEAIRFMDQIRSNPKKRNAFMEELAKACEEEFSSVQHDTSLPYSKRTKSTTEVNGQWKKLPKHILGTTRPLIEMNDASVARTKLLVLYAEILKLGKEGKPYPESLDVFTKDLTIDPFSGGSFLYHADQAEFSLYSVGKNGRDDGGDTDETFTFPDLRLECPGQ